MSGQDFDPEAVIDVMATWLDLDVDSAYRPGIVTNLGIASGFAALVMGAPLDDDVEPAPVFRP